MEAEVIKQQVWRLPISNPFEGNDQRGAAAAIQGNGSQHLGGRAETLTKVNPVGWSKGIVYREPSDHANREFFSIKLRRFLSAP